MLDSLTNRQREVLDCIRDLIVNRGYGPTVRELMAYFAWSSPSGVICHLKALEKKGYITRDRNVSRGIMLTTDAKRSTRGIPIVDLKHVTEG